MIPPEQPLSEDRPEHASEQRAVEELVREAMGRLPERARTALLLRYFAGAPYPELAAKLGVPIPQAHLIVHRSVRRFARELVLVLSRSHGAIECAPAIEQMMGIGAATDDHMDGPCHRCRAVWDEINALRFPALILTPLLAVRRLVKRSRVPSLVDPGAGLMAALVAVTLSASAALSPPAPAAQPPSFVSSPIAPAVSPTHDSESEPENEHGEATEDREAPPPETPTPSADAGSSQPVSILGVTVEPEEGHSHVDARSHDDKGAVVLVCKPLEPCPPEEPEEPKEPEEEPPPEEETTP